MTAARRRCWFGQRPLRLLQLGGARATSSAAAYRALCLQRLGRVPEAAQALRRGQEEAPGDALVLAASAVRWAGTPEGAEAAQALSAMYDPFTGALALVRAQRAWGPEGAWRATLAGLERALPRWQRPRVVGAEP